MQTCCTDVTEVPLYNASIIHHPSSNPPHTQQPAHCIAAHASMPLIVLIKPPAHPKPCSQEWQAQQPMLLRWGAYAPSTLAAALARSDTSFFLVS